MITLFPFLKILGGLDHSPVLDSNLQGDWAEDFDSHWRNCHSLGGSSDQDSNHEGFTLLQSLWRWCPFLKNGMVFLDGYMLFLSHPAEVCDWEAQLAKIQTILEIWIHVQQHWLYLEPIFTTEDIVMQMPTEGTMFKVCIPFLEEIQKHIYMKFNTQRMLTHVGGMSWSWWIKTPTSWLWLTPQMSWRCWQKARQQSKESTKDSITISRRQGWPFQGTMNHGKTYKCPLIIDQPHLRPSQCMVWSY